MRLLAQRLLALPFVALAVMTFTFVVLRLIPGDPVMYRAAQALTPQQIELFRAQWGLDQPMWKQYLAFVDQLRQGSLGLSLTSGQPVTTLLARNYPLTVELALFAAVLSGILGLGLGVVAALDRGGKADYAIRFLSSLFFSIPWFWLALLLVIVFAVNQHWLPVSGLIDTRFQIPNRTGFLLVDSLLAGRLDAFWDVILHLLLPAISLSASMVGYLARITRAQMLEVLDADFVRTGRSKGLPGRILVPQHVLRNALLPVVTIFGLQFGQLLAGALITERVFARPGVSTLLLQGITERDYAVVQGTIIVIASTYVAVNLVVDLVYGVIDPRVRLRA
jgi:ABC-type dipeptide/oligopeptide/nickel transport system permease component